MAIKINLTTLSILLLIPLLILAAGCQSQTSPPETPITAGTITIESLQVEPGNHIVITGATDLPDRTCLETMLYENDEPLPWWPSDCMRVSNGKWQVNISLGSGEVPAELSQEDQYSLEVWYQDNPTVKAEPFYFDLAGPPPPAE
jgi:hypothetical protein